MTLTTNGKNWIAEHFGKFFTAPDRYCYAEGGILYTDPSGKAQTGSTADVVLTLVFGHLVGDPRGPNGETYDDMKAGNDGIDITGDDANWVDTNTPTYCYYPATPTVTPTSTPTPTVTPTPTSTPVPEYGNLSGYIRDKETTELLPGVLIDIAGKQTTTNESGYYRITDIPVGSHKLTISKTRYITQVPTIEIHTGENYYNTSLERAPAAYGDIKGRVLDRHGNPIKGAIAKVEDTGQSDDTDSFGYFVITSVPVGTHIISITAAGYETERIEADVSEGLNNVGDITVYPSAMPISSAALCLFPRVITGSITPRISTGDPVPRISCLLKEIFG